MLHEAAAGARHMPLAAGTDALLPRGSTCRASAAPEGRAWEFRRDPGGTGLAIGPGDTTQGLDGDLRDRDARTRGIGAWPDARVGWTAQERIVVMKLISFIVMGVSALVFAGCAMQADAGHDASEEEVGAAAPWGEAVRPAGACPEDEGGCGSSDGGDDGGDGSGAGSGSGSGNGSGTGDGGTTPQECRDACVSDAAECESNCRGITCTKMCVQALDACEALCG
jgi:hypothetical protein